MSNLTVQPLTDVSWNPIRGCTRISPGCMNCYAARFAERFRGVPGHPYESGFDLRLVPEKLSEPLRWVRPRRIFVCSMSDLFHKDVPDDYIEAVARVMHRARWHTFGVLTRRSERMRDLLQDRLRFAAQGPGIWWGVSVEDRKHGLPRVGHLRAAGVRSGFLCIEPLLEELGQLNLDGVGWVVVGAESGPHARPTNPAWVRSIRDQSHRARVPFYFKQAGSGRFERETDLAGPSCQQIPARQQVAILDGGLPCH